MAGGTGNRLAGERRSKKDLWFLLVTVSLNKTDCWRIWLFDDRKMAHIRLTAPHPRGRGRELRHSGSRPVSCASTQVGLGACIEGGARLGQERTVSRVNDWPKVALHASYSPVRRVAGLCAYQDTNGGANKTPLAELRSAIVEWSENAELRTPRATKLAFYRSEIA